MFEFVLYDAFEPMILRALPWATWLRSTRGSGKGAPRTEPSFLCRLLFRIPYICAITALAAAFPFIS